MPEKAKPHPTLERLPLLGPCIKRRRESGVVSITERVGNMVSHQLGKHVIRNQFTDLTGELLLENYSFGLREPQDKKLSVDVWVAYKNGALRESYQGPNLAYSYRIKEDLPDTEQRNEIQMQQRLDAPYLIQNHLVSFPYNRAVDLGGVLGSFRYGRLDETVTFLNKILTSQFDQEYTIELLQRANEFAEMNNRRTDRNQNQNVSLQIGNHELQKIII